MSHLNFKDPNTHKVDNIKHKVSFRLKIVLDKATGGDHINFHINLLEMNQYIASD